MYYPCCKNKGADQLCRYRKALFSHEKTNLAPGCNAVELGFEQRTIRLLPVSGFIQKWKSKIPGLFQDIFTFFKDRISPMFQPFFGENGKTDDSHT